MAQEGSALRGEKKEPVAYERFAEVAAENKAMKAKIAELEPIAAEHPKIKAKLDKVTAEFDGAKSSWGEERGLFAAGVTDPEGHAIARTLYSTLPAEGKPATLAEWVSGFRTDPSKAPRGLAPYLPTQASTAQEQPRPTPTTPNPAGTGKLPTATGSLTADVIKAATDRALRSGNMAELDALMKSIERGSTATT